MQASSEVLMSCTSCGLKRKRTELLVCRECGILTCNDCCASSVEISATPLCPYCADILQHRRKVINAQPQILHDIKAEVESEGAPKLSPDFSPKNDEIHAQQAQETILQENRQLKLKLQELQQKYQAATEHIHDLEESLFNVSTRADDLQLQLSRYQNQTAAAAQFKSKAEKVASFPVVLRRI